LSPATTVQLVGDADGAVMLYTLGVSPAIRYCPVPECVLVKASALMVFPPVAKAATFGVVASAIWTTRKFAEAGSVSAGIDPLVPLIGSNTPIHSPLVAELLHVVPLVDGHI
jgi:hypothetical protein